MQWVARSLDIPIGHFYPWGALIAPPQSVMQTLIELACLIHQGSVSYRYWESNENISSLLVPIEPENYIKLSDEPQVRFRSISGPVYFSSDDSTLVVDGIPLQNQLAMVLPYDRTIAELEQLLERFRKYFLRKAATHRANLGDLGARERERDARIAAMLPELKTVRVEIAP